MLPGEPLAFSLCASFLAVLKKGGTETASAEAAVRKAWRSVWEGQSLG